MNEGPVAICGAAGSFSEWRTCPLQVHQVKLLESRCLASRMDKRQERTAHDVGGRVTRGLELRARELAQQASVKEWDSRASQVLARNVAWAIELQICFKQKRLSRFHNRQAGLPSTRMARARISPT